MAIKLIALDLDGTTLQPGGVLSDYTRAVLERALAQGIKVVPTTGRVLAAMPEEILELKGLEYIITSNGASIIEVMNQEEIYQNLMPVEHVSELLTYLEAYPIMIELFAEGKAYVEERFYNNPHQYGVSEDFIEYVRRTRIPIADRQMWLSELSKGVENINLVFKEPQMRNEALEKLGDFKTFTVTSSLNHNIELGGVTTNKGSALKYLCDSLGILPEEVMAAGDNHNDLALLTYAGLPITVENAIEEAKALAHHITESNEFDGIGRFIEALMNAVE